MARFKKDKKRELPALGTGSMADIVFMFLFFFMVISNMRETDVKVKFIVPGASEIQKLEKKSLVATIYMGMPKSENENTLPPGKVSVQLNDQTIKQENFVRDVRDFIAVEKESRSDEDRQKLTFSIKADQDIQMRYINLIKNELRTNNALKINYATTKRERKQAESKE
ncbi:MAG: biopolymer transporter ExbD [Lentimicrobiaceae bacterium]|nr:biopolymer transporter ExbD [Lentimicrobiaceae bacterium]